MDNRKRRRRSKPRRRLSLFTTIILILCGYFTVSIVTTQIETYNQRKTLEELERKINETRLANDELERLMTDGESAYIERVARDKLGYASIDERVYVDING